MTGRRARYDASRRFGNANAISAGVDLTRVAVISSRELTDMRSLAQQEKAVTRNDSKSCNNNNNNNDNIDDSDTHAARAAEELRRRAASQQRTAQWSDTKQALHDTFLRQHEAKRQAAEQRRIAMDELHAEKREAERRTAVASAAMTRLRDDARVHTAMSVMMLHKVMQERDAQVALHARCVREARAEEQQTRLQAQFDDWVANTAAMQHRLAKREATVNNARANLLTVQCQVEQRRRERVADKDERAHAEAEAHAERQEKLEAARDQCARAAACAAYNKATATSPVTPSQAHEPDTNNACVSLVAKLRARAAHHAAEMAKLQQQTSSLATIHAANEAAAQQRRAKTELRQQRAIDHVAALHAKASVTEQTQDRFATLAPAVAASAVLIGSTPAPRSGVDVQLCNREQDAHASTATAAAHVATTRAPFSHRNGGAADAHRKASIATRSGDFLSADDERAFVDAMHKSAKEWSEQQAATASSRRKAAALLADALQCQAAYKRTCEANAVADEHANEQAALVRTAAETAALAEYVTAQLGDNIPPKLRQRALQGIALGESRRTG